MTVPIVLGSANARVGLPAAIAALRAGRSAMDAAVSAVKCVEDNRDDHGVGTGGIPNVLGQVELDASVMDGRTLAAGAVAAIKGYHHPIEIARMAPAIISPVAPPLALFTLRTPLGHPNCHSIGSLGKEASGSTPTIYPRRKLITEDRTWSPAPRVPRVEVRQGMDGGLR